MDATDEDEKDAQALLHVETVIHGARELETPWECMRNFVVMSALFASSFSTVSSLLTFSSSVFACDPAFANITGAVMWGSFSLSGLLISSPVNVLLGPKLGMTLGLALNSVNCAMFAVAHAALGASNQGGDDDKACTIDAWVMASMIASSAMAGIGSGIMWPAQGTYFYLSALLYSKQTGKEVQEVLNQFSGIFSGFIFSFQVCVKLLLSLIPLDGNIVWVALTVQACVSACGMGCITHLYTEEVDNITWYSRVTAAGRFLCSDRRIRLASTLPVSFGFGVAYSSYSITKGIVSDGPGIEYLGYGTCLMAGTAAIVSQLSLLCVESKHGVGLYFLLLGVWAAMVAVVGYSNLQSWPLIVLVVVIFGTCRGLYESAGRAWFAEYFPRQIKSAFAVMAFMNGTATCMALLVRQFLPEETIGVGVVVACCAGVLACEVYLQHEPTEKE